MRRIYSSVITNMNLSSQWYLKQKSQDFEYEKKIFQKKNKTQTVREQLVEQTSIERWKHDTDCDKMKENDYNFHLI